MPRLQATTLDTTMATILRTPVAFRCPMCSRFAVVPLTPAQLAKQPDDTTHVCHPALCGCNHGFTLEG